MTEVDEINDKLDEISLTVNHNFDLSIKDVTYHTENCAVTSETIIEQIFSALF